MAKAKAKKPEKLKGKRFNIVLDIEFTAEDEFDVDEKAQELKRELILAIEIRQDKGKYLWLRDMMINCSVDELEEDVEYEE